MDMPATSHKCPASTRQPTASVGSISPPHSQPPPPTDNEAMLYSIMWHRKGECNRERKSHILHTSLPPAFCTKTKVANVGGGGGGGGVFAGHCGIRSF